MRALRWRILEEFLLCFSGSMPKPEQQALIEAVPATRPPLGSLPQWKNRAEEARLAPSEGSRETSRLLTRRFAPQDHKLRPGYRRQQGTSSHRTSVSQGRLRSPPASTWLSSTPIRRSSCPGRRLLFWVLKTPFPEIQI